MTTFLPLQIRTPMKYGHPMDRARILRSCLPHVSLTKVWWRGTAPEVRDLPRPKEPKRTKAKKEKKEAKEED